MDDNEKREQEVPEVNEEPADTGREQFRDNTTEELKDLYSQVKEQLEELNTELKARHAAPEGAEGDAPDWNAQFDSYRAPYRSGKE